MTDTIINFYSVSKSYRIHQRGFRSFRDEFINWAKRKGRNVKHKEPFPLRYTSCALPSSKDLIWALKDVSFDVKKGEALGIIGANGAGKTTILRLLSKVTAPTKGSIDVMGKVAPLIQVGAGFHPEFTGRENVYLNAAIMGLSKEEVDEKYNDIVSFAELEGFMDTPVKRYSSGMYVRLGFATAVHNNANILLIDEILSVGDLSFQRKCLDFMNEIRKTETSIVFVSHNFHAVGGFCDRVIWLDKGEIQKEGEPGEVINAYTSYMTSKSQNVHNIFYVGSKTQWGTGEVKLTNVEVLNSQGETEHSFIPGDEVTILLEYEAYKKIESPTFWVGIYNSNEVRVFGSYYNRERIGEYSIEGKGKISCRIGTQIMRQGEYYVMVGIYDPIAHYPYDRIGRAEVFRIEGEKVSDYDKYFGYGAPGTINLPHQWEIVK